MQAHRLNTNNQATIYCTFACKPASQSARSCVGRRKGFWDTKYSHKWFCNSSIHQSHIFLSVTIIFGNDDAMRWTNGDTLQFCALCFLSSFYLTISQIIIRWVSMELPHRRSRAPIFELYLFSYSKCFILIFEETSEWWWAERWIRRKKRRRQRLYFT